MEIGKKFLWLGLQMAYMTFDHFLLKVKIDNLVGVQKVVIC